MFDFFYLSIMQKCFKTIVFSFSSVSSEGAMPHRMQRRMSRPTNVKSCLENFVEERSRRRSDHHHHRRRIRRKVGIIKRTCEASGACHSTEFRPSASAGYRFKSTSFPLPLGHFLSGCIGIQAENTYVLGPILEHIESGPLLFG